MDTKLQHQIRKGDRRAFKIIFDNYFNALCAFGYRYVQNTSQVEDVVQDAFISFWNKREDFDTLNTIKAFLYTSVRNKCLNLIKHQQIKQKHEAALIYELESEQHFEGHVIEEETFNKLYTEIQKLPKAAHEIMILALNGLKNPEIAKELNISVNTVKTQKKISYSKLKEKLSPAMHAVLLSLG